MGGLLFWICSVFFLAGGISPAFFFGAFLLLFFCPIVFIAFSLLVQLQIPDNLRIMLSLLFPFLVIIPWSFLKKASGFPGPFVDLISVIILLLIIFQRGNAKGFFHEISGTFTDTFRTFNLVAIPLLFCLSWTAFEVHCNGMVGYYGLYLIDFGSLSEIVSLVNVSPHFPLNHLEGIGALSYHWLFFSIPSFIADFMGSPIKHPHALGLANLLVTHLLFLVLYFSAGNFLVQGEENNKSLQAWSAFSIVFCSTIFQFYLRLTEILKFSFLQIPRINHLLMSVINSITGFGNNTLALSCILIGIMLIIEWNKQERPVFLFFGSILFAMPMALSVTLVFPTSMAIFILIISGRIRHAFKAALTGLFFGAVFFGIFKLIGIFGGNAGRIGVDFDRGYFVRNVFFSLFPAIIVSFFGLERPHRENIFLVFLGCCLVIPSFLLVKDTPYGRIDFSMKIASLIAVLMTPLFAKGMAYLVARRSIKLAIFPVFFILLGLLHTTAFSCQFLFYRAFSPQTRCFSFPEAHFNALDFVRRQSPKTAIVADPFFSDRTDTHINLFVSERRQFLPIEKDFLYHQLPEEIQKRRQFWEEWEKSSFQDKERSRYFAEHADYVVVDKSVSDSNWEPVFQAGDFFVYKSRISKF